MATTLRSDLIIPEILAEDLMEGFEGKPVFSPSGAAVVRPGLAVGSPEEVNTTVKIPYFEDGGEAQVVPEGSAGSLDKITMRSEDTTLVRLFKGYSVATIARMAKSAGRDIYEVARMMLQGAFARAIDSLILTRVLARATSASMEYDGTAANISTDAIVETLKLFGEELDDSELALWAMNPKPYWDAATLTDSIGRTLYTDVKGGRLTQVGGAPVRMTAKSGMVTAGSPNTYKSVLLKRGSCAVWYNENASVDIVRDPTADVDMVMSNLYLTVHCYSVMNNGTKAGVAVLKSR